MFISPELKQAFIYTVLTQNFLHETSGVDVVPVKNTICFLTCPEDYPNPSVLLTRAYRYPPVPVRSLFAVMNTRMPGNEMNNGIQSLHVRQSGTIVNRKPVTGADPDDLHTHCRGGLPADKVDLRYNRIR